MALMQGRSGSDNHLIYETMRLFVSLFAPNVMRVQVTANEKSLSLETVDASADRSGYLSTNPLGQVPALELPDGTILTESLTICQYLDSISAPPFLFGDDAKERLTIAMWERRAEMQLFNVGVDYGHHVHPMFANFFAQFPEYAATLVPKVNRAAKVFSDQLEKMPYLTGDRFGNYIRDVPPNREYGKCDRPATLPIILRYPPQRTNLPRACSGSLKTAPRGWGKR